MSMIIGNKTFSFTEDTIKPARVVITNMVEQLVKRHDGDGTTYENTYLQVTYEFNYLMNQADGKFQFMRHTDTVQLPIRKVTLEKFKESLIEKYKKYGSKISNAKKVEPIIVLE